MVIRITIDTENSAFEGGPESEIVRLLQTVVTTIQRYGVPKDSARLLDINGNTVGDVTIEER
jgi:hypothetical protein